jgi:hypothetical protein
MNDLPVPRLSGLNGRTPAWLAPGRLLAGCSPALGAPEDTPQRLHTLLQTGIDTFFNLTLPDEHIDYTTVLNAEVQRLGIQAVVRRFPLTAEDLDILHTLQRLLDALDEALNQQHRVYLHCWSGFGRTGVAVGCYLVRHGSTPRQALAWIDQLRRGMQAPPIKDTAPYSLVLQWQPGQ